MLVAWIRRVSWVGAWIEVGGSVVLGVVLILEMAERGVEVCMRVKVGLEGGEVVNVVGELIERLSPEG